MNELAALRSPVRCHSRTRVSVNAVSGVLDPGGLPSETMRAPSARFFVSAAHGNASGDALVPPPPSNAGSFSSLEFLSSIVWHPADSKVRSSSTVLLKTRVEYIMRVFIWQAMLCCDLNISYMPISLKFDLLKKKRSCSFRG